MDFQWILRVFLVKSVLAIEVFNHDNGWKPLPVEVALFHTIGSPRNFNKDIALDTKSDVIKIIKPHRLNQFVRDRKSKTITFEDEHSNEAEIRSLFNDIENNNMKIPWTPKSHESKHDVKEKNTKINLATLTIDRATNIAELNDKENYDKEIRQNSILYEVTEKPGDREEAVIRQNDLEERSPYVYKIPEKPLTMPPFENLMEKFLDILAKYNLNSKVSEVNYVLSRTRKNNENRNIFVTMPLRVPSRYNNPYHIPKDAILAMILSNYGLYLPGMFGYSDQYKNLLEHLKSINFNNNKSFGLYKTFSDTDSSQ